MQTLVSLGNLKVRYIQQQNAGKTHSLESLHTRGNFFDLVFPTQVKLFALFLFMVP